MFRSVRELFITFAIFPTPLHFSLVTSFFKEILHLESYVIFYGVDTLITSQVLNTVRQETI